jgi:hypothetical protein
MLERVCRYITRPAIAEQRLSLTGHGNVVVELKSPYDDGCSPTSNRLTIRKKAVNSTYTRQPWFCWRTQDGAPKTSSKNPMPVKRPHLYIPYMYSEAGLIYEIVTTRSSELSWS